MRIVTGIVGALAALALAACSEQQAGGAGQGGAGQGAGAAGPVTELRIGLTAPETASEIAKGLEAYRSYLERELGVKVSVAQASDYAGVAQAIAAGQIDLAPVGPSNYAAMALAMGDQVAPIATTEEVDGSTGYYTMLFVRADSPYQTLEDLRGKSLAFSDVNSASGYLVPRFALRKEGKEPETFFGQTIFAGGHPQAVIAVLRGQADAGVTWASNIGEESQGYSRGTFNRMVAANQLAMADLRILWRYGPIPNGPLVIRTALPADFRQKVLQAHLDMKEKSPEAFVFYAQGSGNDLVAVDAALYADIIEMRKAEEAARRGN